MHRPAMKGGRRTLKRSQKVSFNDDHSVHGVPNIAELTDDEVVATWFTNLECTQIKTDMQKCIDAIDAGHNDVESRGLEARTKDGHWKAYKARQNACDVVLKEQETLQRRRKPLDWESIALLYMAETANCVTVAQSRGKEDEKQAKLYNVSHPPQKEKKAKSNSKKVKKTKSANKTTADKKRVKTKRPTTRAKGLVSPAATEIDFPLSSPVETTPKPVVVFPVSPVKLQSKRRMSDVTCSTVATGVSTPDDIESDYDSDSSVDSKEERRRKAEAFIKRFGGVKQHQRNAFERPVKIKAPSSKSRRAKSVCISRKPSSPATTKKLSHLKEHLITVSPPRSKSVKLRDAMRTLEPKQEEDELSLSRHNATRRRVPATDRLSIVLFQD